MAIQVRETKAGRSISAWVVLNKRGDCVATVNAHYSDGGRVSVDVWNHGEAAQRCFVVALSCGALSSATADKARGAVRSKRDWVRPEDVDHWAAYDLFGFQQSSAGGYGYDRLTAALSGLWIDGHRLADNCGTVPEDEKKRAALYRAYRKAEAAGQVDRKVWNDKAQKIGCHFSNWSSEDNAYSSLYFVAGLPRLDCLGYQLIQAI